MNQRKTTQKQIIEDEISIFRNFFSAEEIHKSILEKNKNDPKINKKIGIATIYRFLKERTSKGKLHSYLCDRKTVYSQNEKSHCHFICESCGNKTHIEIKKIDFLKNKVKGSICHFQIDIVGVCEKCTEKNRKAKSNKKYELNLV